MTTMRCGGRSESSRFAITGVATTYGKLATNFVMRSSYDSSRISFSMMLPRPTGFEQVLRSQNIAAHELDVPVIVHGFHRQGVEIAIDFTRAGSCRCIGLAIAPSSLPVPVPISSTTSRSYCRFPRRAAARAPATEIDQEILAQLLFRVNAASGKKIANA